jgi:probable phosphoglycerate mutase
MTGNLFENTADTGATAAGGWFTAHCDGGSRGNPGPAGYGAIVEDPRGQEVARLSEFLGRQTNNYAEYKGLLAVLAWALANGVRRLRVFSDSELMVRQMKGVYKVKNPGLRPLWEEAQRQARQLDAFEMRHTLRGGNKEADKLANAAMDRGMGKTASQQVSGTASHPGAPEPALSMPKGPASGTWRPKNPPAKS